jgi:NAD(P)-dependent dehydrogenase (short-subunit alcohol dehydrogenase family)
VIETNLFGQIHGSRAALAQFRRQGSGVLINMSSVWGRVTSPYVSAYVTSKFAVRAFSECLRQELQDADDIHVVTILPQAVKTPMFSRAGNYSGRRVKQLPVPRPADEIAKRIVWCSEDPKREVTDRRFGRLLEIAHAVAPGLWERLSLAMATGRCCCGCRGATRRSSSLRRTSTACSRGRPSRSPRPAARSIQVARCRGR